jgi:transketolase
VEISSGSLGHGLAIGVGLALELRAQRNPARTVVRLGDAELDAGSNHEAIVVAGAARLDGLTAIVVDNRSSSLGWPGGLARRFASEGWAAETVDGRPLRAWRAEGAVVLPQSTEGCGSRRAPTVLLDVAE